ncbi:MAG TPA: gephyrin-like molybdotransferase Glp [Bacteroidales bacterium]|nr:gephyrin-like molybdotransferase Glp [Bacteroidales bacterium]
MIPFEEAYRIVLGEAPGRTTEKVPLDACFDRFLAADIFSDTDLPPFHKAAVDGFAIRREDLSRELEVIETIPAGKTPEMNIGEGQCSRIMTGAMVPHGADCILMVEDTETGDHGKIRFTRDKTADNIAFRGEDIKAGDKVLEAGTRLAPQHLAVLAAAGVGEVPVTKKIKAAILSTGDELTEPWEKPGSSKIRNTNAAQLVAQVIRAGGIPDYCGIARDEPEHLSQKITAALEKNDVLLITGGVSMGDLDFVPGVFRDLGIRILFHNVSIRPGKPVLFGRNNDRFIFGLPGNPVSSFVLFEVLVRPFLVKAMGGRTKEPELRLPLGDDFHRRDSSRKAFIPVKILRGEIFPVDYHGSAHIHAYAHADGIITMETGTGKLEKGTLTYVRPV